MAKSIQENAAIILESLAKLPRDIFGRSEVDGNQLAARTNLIPMEINDAVTLLVSSRYAEWIQTIGTTPYDFHSVSITPLGRYEYERLQDQAKKETVITEVIRPPVPIGSPYGFHDEDWEIVSLRKADQNKLFVVLGYQFNSMYFDSDKLCNNIEGMFKKAVDEYNKKPESIKISLSFKPLAAGYGEHLFNEIARDIISADVAVFETSDMNANVMIEMGVALTWGVRVLPLKRNDRPKPPSDISGQTWADYQESCEQFIDPEHHMKLLSLVER
ncbi:hypothetical protein FJY84_08710, partial [Candidatus Bathyarchaeota archaeon]|nr:hypothetical protein [Candidatus Bathyarchaeota archaeon]